MTDPFPGNVPDKAREALKAVLRRTAGLLDAPESGLDALADRLVAAVLPVVRRQIADEIEREDIALRPGQTATQKNQIRIASYSAAITRAARVVRGDP